MHHQILRVNLLKLLLGAELVGVATALLAAVVCARVKAGVAPSGDQSDQYGTSQVTAR